MRIRRIRFDIWFCMLLAFGVSLGTAKAAEMITSHFYAGYVEEHTVADGDIGGRAGEDIPRIQSVNDLLREETFTIVSHGIEYCNRGAGYYGGTYTYAVTLPSGEVVAAVINMENVQYEGDYYTSDHTLPVGKIVYDDLTKDTYFMNQIQHGVELSRTDFYIDMRGRSGKVSQETYTGHYADIVQVITVLICFPIFHSIGAKLGLFPFFFTPKAQKERKSEWD